MRIQRGLSAFEKNKDWEVEFVLDLEADVVGPLNSTEKVDSILFGSRISLMLASVNKKWGKFFF